MTDNRERSDAEPAAPTSSQPPTESADVQPVEPDVTGVLESGSDPESDDTEADESATDASGNVPTGLVTIEDGDSAETVAHKVAAARPKRKVATGGGASAEAPASKGVQRKSTANKQLDSDTKRTTPVQFVRESIGELKRVVWPTAAQLRQYFVVVLVFVVLIIAYVSLLDLGLGAALLKIFGQD